MKTKIIFVLAALLATVSLSGLWLIDYAKKQKTERIRQENNVYALTEELNIRKVQDSINVSQKRVLELKASEFEKMFVSEAEKVKMLGIKLKNVQSYVNAQVAVTDTIRDIKVEYVSDSLLKFKHSDNFFISLNGEIRGDKAVLDYQARLELNIVQHREPKRFLGFLWETKKTHCVKVEAFSMNPKVRVDGITVIKID